MSVNKIDKATSTITSSNKFLHELKRIVINIVTYLVLGFIAYENRGALIKQATRTVIHEEVVDEVDHLPHLDVKAWNVEKIKMLKRLNKQDDIIKENKQNIKDLLKNSKNDSVRINRAYRRLDVLLDKIKKINNGNLE